ncbi:MAG TPA: hypothetical protein DCE41_15080 [Cytophagales bacterium]|nr:hypothetical protein [Cytophagales bacterium]HAA24312.1 hypothetical protein [Cytophagales bacterium]HAP59737.1 hypothetical protein [Cytophagales bacterium]
MRPLFLLLYLLPVAGHTQSLTGSFIGHAHNDYEHTQPLYQALGYGFESIEVDVFNKGGQLVVGHNPYAVGRKPSLEELYFAPLRQLVKKREGTLWLLVDLKKYNEELMELLHVLCEQYEDILMTRNDSVGTKPVQVILSGNYPRAEVMANEKFRFFFIDGRFPELASYNAKLVPMVSANFTQYCWYRGNGPITRNEAEEILGLVAQAHAKGMKVRFWRTEDNENVWETLKRLGVDVIGVDDLVGFTAYRN